MTSPVSAIEAIEKAMEGVTPGPWHVAESGLGNKVKAPTVYHAGDDLNYVASFADFMTFHGPTRNLENARYIAACNPVAMREVLALARQAEALQRENAEKGARIAALEGALDESQSMHLSALRRDVVSRDALQKIVNSVLTWAEQRCPCKNEQPNPCPLCGASVENLEPCKSAENTIPRHLLADLRRARALLGGSENAGN